VNPKGRIERYSDPAGKFIEYRLQED